MNKEQFIKDPDQFEDIGAPLGSLGRWSISSSVIPNSVTPQAITSDDSKIYIRTSGNNNRDIKRFTLSGTYESAGDVTLPLPTAPNEATGSTPNRIIGLSYLNNKFYVILWWNASPPDYVTIERYSSTFSHESTVLGYDPGINTTYEDFMFTTNYLFVLTTQGHAIRTNHAFNSGTHTFASGQTDAVNIVALTDHSPDRSYLVEPDNVRAYTIGGTRISTDDFTLPTRLGTPRGSVFINDDLYIVGNDTTDNNWSVYSFGDRSIVASASWSNASYTGGKLQATLTFDRDVTGISASDFTVVDSLGREYGGWTFDTPSTTASANTGITIATTPPANTSGSFGIQIHPNSVLGPNALIGNSPSNRITSDVVIVNNLPAITISSFTAETSSTTNRITAATATFTLTLGMAIPSSQLTTADFSLRTSEINLGASISSVTAVNPTNENSNTYTISVNNPPDFEGGYPITINTNAIDGSSTYGSGPLSTDPNRTSAIVYYDTRTNVSISSFTAPSETQRGITSTFILEIDRTIPSSDITTSDFTVQSGSGAAINSVSPINELGFGVNSFSIVVTNPENRSGSYTITLNANSIPRNSGFLPGPVTAQVSDAVTYDTRPSVEGSSFTAPSGIQRGATSIFRLVLNRAVPTAEITVEDFTASITQATISSITGVSISNNITATYDITVNNPTNSAGSYTVSLNANAVASGTNYAQGPSSAYQSTAVAYNTFPFSVTWGSSRIY